MSEENEPISLYTYEPDELKEVRKLKHDWEMLKLSLLIKERIHKEREGLE